MLTETFHSIVAAARNVFRNLPAMLMIAIVYASLLAVIYFFVVIREATVTQITLTFASGIVAPLLFFILQAMVANDAEQTGALLLLRRALTNFWKLILVTLPLIALGILLVYLLGKLQLRLDASLQRAAAEEFGRRAETLNARSTSHPIEWRVALLATVRYLAFGLVLPLAAIQMWIATMQNGLIGGLKKIGTVLARTFAPRSVLIYVAGFLIFAVGPYYLLFKTTQTSHAWVELFLLVVRLVAVFALTLFGWVITVRALARNPVPVAETEPAVETA
ncbi:MAG TPA: hypothetical protein VLL54_11320 [Pyrinomonadaceae bacterium]|nr:hypothetical protein [Pyrinomonadaceae bacterium]